jgi:hypothetical protein
MLFQTKGSQDLHVTVNLRKEKEKAEKGETTTAKQSVGGWVRGGVGVGVVPPHDIMF